MARMRYQKLVKASRYSKLSRNHFPLHDDGILNALRLAFIAARERHLRGGVPMVFYENGKVVEIDAKKVRIPKG